MHDLKLKNREKSLLKVCHRSQCGAPMLWERHVEDREGTTAPEMDVISPAMQQI